MTTDERTAAALERVATALEQLVLAQIPEAPRPTAVLADEPPLPDVPPTEFTFGQRPQPVQGSLTAVCPIHKTPWTIKPAGVSQKTGKPYEAFYKCDGRMDDGSFCKQKPARPAA